MIAVNSNILALKFVPQNIQKVNSANIIHLINNYKNKNTPEFRQMFTNHDKGTMQDIFFSDILIHVISISLYAGDFFDVMYLEKNSNCIIIKVIEKDIKKFTYLPQRLFNKEICRIVISKDVNQIRYFGKNSAFFDINMCIDVVTKNGLLLEFIPEDLRNFDICNIAVCNNGIALKFVPENLRNIDIYNIAVYNNGLSLEFVPIKYQTLDIIKTALIQNEKAAKFILSEHDQKLCKSTKYEEKYLITLDKIRKILQSFTQEECFENFDHDNIINLDHEKYYYSSLNLTTNIDISNVSAFFGEKKYCWFSPKLNQGLLHLFNSFREPQDTLSSTNTLIQPYICRFKLKTSIRIINSENICNNTIFKGILREKIIKYIEIILTYGCEKSKADNNLFPFQRENNKYILYILKLLNELYLSKLSKEIYGYQNIHDQQEVALINFDDNISKNDVKISKILCVKKKDKNNIETTYNFPTDKGTYKKDFMIVSYANSNYYTEGIKDIDKKCTIKRKMLLLSGPIYYQDFDNIDQQLEEKVEIFANKQAFEKYFEKKYFKYKAKYLKLKNI